MFFVIANNLLAPNTKATNLGISPLATSSITLNNFKNFKDGSCSLKHLEKYSYTILESPPQDK